MELNEHLDEMKKMKMFCVTGTKQEQYVGNMKNDK